jgi:glucose-1-phosphate thymidylyltransferase
MLRVNGRPVIDFLVERMRVGGAEEIRIITRPEKHDVIEYAEEIGATLVLGHPIHMDASFAAGLEGLLDGDTALLGFPDSLWEPVDGYRALVEAVRGEAEIALGLFEAPGLTGSDFLALDKAGGIAHIEIKPARPPSDWIWGAAAARPRALDGLADEEWPSEYMNSVIQRGGALSAIRLSSEYLDIGTPQSLEVLASSHWVA